MHMQWSRCLSCSLVTTLVLAGCAVGPSYQRPEVLAPQNWTAALADNRWPTLDWWTEFHDPALDRLVNEALANNHNLSAAVARVAEARAGVQVASAALYPSLDFDAQAGRQQSSSNNTSNSSQATSGKNSTGSATSNSQTSTVSNFFQLGLTASYELDLFGQNRDQALAAAAALKGSQFDRQTVALGVAAAVVSTYFELSAFDAQLKATREDLDSARHTLDLIRAQNRAGMATELQVAQQASQVATIEASLPALVTQRTQARNALAILLGRAPENFDITPAAIGSIVPPTPPAGLPSALLERRPDIASAEAALEAANANVRAATAALFPSIDLTAQGGYSSVALSQLFNPYSAIFSLMGGLTAPLFEGGKLQGELASSKARYQELAQNYQQAVISAFGDVENALVAQANTQSTLDAQHQAVVQADRAYRLAESQYRQGTVDYLTVLDTERTWITARNAEVQSQLARLAAAVSLYQALGGGWSEALVADTPQR